MVVSAGRGGVAEQSAKGVTREAWKLDVVAAAAAHVNKLHNMSIWGVVDNRIN